MGVAQTRGPNESPLMPVDPLLKAFFDQLAQTPTPKLWEMTPEQGRQAFLAMVQLVGPKDVPVGKVENRKIPGPGGEIPVRIYTPIAAGSDPLPALVYFHGGGFVIGDLDTHDGLCRILASEAGCCVIAVDYRLAPEHRFPAAVDDAYAATCWVEANAPRLGVNANRIAVGGDSAGGTLSAVVTQLAKQKGKPRICFQLLLFPAGQMTGVTRSRRELRDAYFLEAQTLDWFFDHYIADRSDLDDPRASPLLAKDFSGLPPAFVMLAGCDPLHDEGLQYAEKLRGAGVTVAVADYPDLIHCFVYLQAVLPQAREAMNKAAAALRQAFAAG